MTLTGELVFDTAFPSPFTTILSIHCVMSCSITFNWFCVHSYRNIQDFQRYKYQHNKKCLGGDSNRVPCEFVLCAVKHFGLGQFVFLPFIYLFIVCMCILPFAITKELR